MDGPVMSASRMPTEWPSRRMATASMALVMLLPTPPLPDTTPITFLMWLLACGGSCCGAALRLEQLALQLLQSWVHSSLIETVSPLSRDSQARRSAFLAAGGRAGRAVH